jgi:hypothetical protein
MTGARLSGIIDKNLFMRLILALAFCLAASTIATMASGADIPPGYWTAFSEGAYAPDIDTVTPEGRSEVDCSMFHAPGTAILFILGQSNAGNYGRSRYTPTGEVYNFDVLNGRCYKAQDPLLGATGNEGSPWGILGDEMIAHGLAQRVLLAPIAVGGTNILAWVDGKRTARLVYAAKVLRTARLLPTAILWHQGESDAGNHVATEPYVAMFNRLVSLIRSNGLSAPIFVAVATYCNERAPEPGTLYAPIRKAQQMVVNQAKGIYAGPDTDQIRSADRWDNCHFAESGLRKHADLWLKALEAAPKH